MAHDVFVSYSTKDKVVADTIVSALEQNQIRCWYAPRDIQPSDDWGNAITEGIEECKVFLVIFSENANRSQRVLDEVNLAIAQQDVILPFRIENLEPKGAMKLHLSSRHWLDAYEPSWETHIKRLVMTVSNNLEKRLAEEDEKMAEAQPKNAVGKKTTRNVVLGVASVSVVGILAWFGYAYATTGGLPAVIARAEPAVTSKPLPTETEVPPTEAPTQDLVTPTATLFPSAEEELGEPDLETDFSSADLTEQVWPIGMEDADGYVNYDENNNTLILKDIYVDVNKGRKKYINSIIEVEATMNKIDQIGNTNDGLGTIELYCRKGPSGAVYARLNSNGDVEIERVNEGTVIILDAQRFPGFRLGKTYQLRFDCFGNSFQFRINGLGVAFGDDETFFSGFVGLSSVKAEVEYDNFKLWTP